MDKKTTGKGVAFGIILGSLFFAFTGEVYWITIGVAIGAAMGAGASKNATKTVEKEETLQEELQ